jgi:uncharacterized membrane protein YpjA
MNLLYKLQQKVLQTPWFYWLVNGVILGGVIYGFFWYKDQLSITPLQFWIFTPDCPGAAFLFLIWIVLRRLRLPDETFRVVAVTALIKYGIWTVSVLGLFWIDHGVMYWENIMLFVSHIGMLVLGLVFSAQMKISVRAYYITWIWLILNDFVDYYFKVHPWLPDDGRLMEIQIGTFILTGLLIIWMYVRLRKTEAGVFDRNVKV